MIFTLKYDNYDMSRPTIVPAKENIFLNMDRLDQTQTATMQKNQQQVKSHGPVVVLLTWMSDLFKVRGHVA